MSLPNQLTVLRIILTPLFAVVLIFEQLFFKYLSFFIFILASLTDWYDGYFARKHGSITSTGKYLDPLADKLLISTAFGIFTFLGYVPLWMFMVIVLRDVLITALRSYTISTGKLFTTSIWAKWKTATQMFAIYSLFIWMIAERTYSKEVDVPAFFARIKDWDLIGKLMLIVTFYTVTTGMSYLYENRQHLKSLVVAFYRVFVPTNVR